MTRTPAAQKGFTLVEVLIALAVIALMAIFLYETFISSSRVTEKINEEREGYREVRLTIDQMTRELLSAYQSPVAATPLPLTGISEVGPDGRTDSLAFYTMSHLHLITDSPEAELTRVRYYLDKPADAKWYQLEHEEYSHFLSNGPAEREVLIDQVREMTFQYFDGIRWQADWNGEKSPKTTLPSAVRVILVVVMPDGTQQEWRRQINLIPLNPQ